MQSLTKFRRMPGHIQREAFEGYLFIMPWLLGLIVFIIGPIVVSLYLSFTDYEIVRAPTFTGLRNFEQLINDRLFWQALHV